MRKETSGTGQRRIFNVTPERPFVGVLADWLLEHPDLKADPLAMSRVRVLMPTRRGVRALQDAFLKRCKGRPCLLPRMDAIGGLDSEELSLLDPAGFGQGEDFLASPSLINKQTRLLILTQMVLSAGAGLAPRPGADNPDLSYQQALRLAIGLAQLLDQAETEGVDLSGLDELEIRTELSGHWKESCKFLEILFRHWPLIMEQSGYISVAGQRRRLIEQQTASWQSNPPLHMVIAAGSTGSIPSTRSLLKAVLDLPNGALFLPGLDTFMNDEAWDAVGHDPSHPQHNLYHLLVACGFTRADVENPAERPSGIPGKNPGSDRQNLLSAAFLPASVTDQWRTLKHGSWPQALDKLVKIEARDLQQEAGLIAIAMREVLDKDGKTAVLITPDRDLARRVIVEARRWGIELDDSAGLPLKNTTQGLLFRLIAQTMAEGFSPSTLLPVLKHPHALTVEDRERNRRLLRRFEKAFLRGEKPAAGLSGLASAVDERMNARTGTPKGTLKNTGKTAETPEQELIAFLKALEQTFKPLDALKDSQHTMLAYLSAHVAVLKALDKEDLIWRGSAGEALAGFIAGLEEGLSEQGERFGALTKIDAQAYMQCIEALISAEAVRRPYGLHPRLAIWGTMEGRLQQADRVILGGLNEGTWPTRTDPGPWLSRQMRTELGLPSTEKKIGLSAHDFAQACGSPEVFITRALKSGGSETKASRLIQRLDAVVTKTGLTYDEGRARHYLAMTDLLHGQHGNNPTPMTQPGFAPPVALRPKALSVTDYELLCRDPYSIYAKHVLKLRKLQPVEAGMSLLERGNLIHGLLHDFISRYPAGPLPDGITQTLIKAGRAEFEKLNRTAPGATAFWWPRYKRTVQWIIAEETRRRTTGVASQVEISGEFDFGSFKIHGRADRIDRLADGTFEIIDYKTGSIPGIGKIKELTFPQLLLEAVILECSGFEAVNRHTSGVKQVHAVTYWQLKGSGTEPAKQVSLKGDPLKQTLEALTDDLNRKGDFYAEEHNPYLALPDPKTAPAYQDYDILTRESEWRTTTGPDPAEAFET